MHQLGFSREGAGKMLLWTSIGFIIGSMLTDWIARRLFHSYSRTLLAGQLCLSLLMTGFLGWLQLLPHWGLILYFLGIGLTVSTGVMIYPIIRSMVPVSMVGTGLTSLNFFVLMGSAVAQQGMGIIITHSGGYSTEGFRTAFSVPVLSLFLASLLFIFARNYPTGEQ